ncbi:MAG: hypothetical protein K2Y23_08930 [Cyanobacteria bacterium]|nr:hypothetical protein [Cyanobacteriota bacterium]
MKQQEQQLIEFPERVADADLVEDGFIVRREYRVFGIGGTSWQVLIVPRHGALIPVLKVEAPTKRDAIEVAAGALRRASERANGPIDCAGRDETSTDRSRAPAAAAHDRRR